MDLTTLLSMLCILVDVLSRAFAWRGKSCNDSESGTSTGRVSSDSVASTAVKGLRQAECGCQQKSKMLGCKNTAPEIGQFL